MVYLDRVAANVDRWAGTRGRKLDRSGKECRWPVEELLEFKKPGRSGRGSILERHDRMLRYWQLAEYVGYELARGETKMS